MDALFVFFIYVILPLFGGFYTVVVSPLLYPVYPAVLAGGLFKDVREAIKIAVAFAISYTIFTLLWTTIIYTLNVSPETVRYVALALTALLGFILVFLTKGSPIVYGAVVGGVWATWVGPFMPQLDYYAPKSVDFTLTCLTYLFGIGAGAFVFLVTFLMQKLLKFLKLPPTTVSLILGGLLVLLTVAIGVGWITIPAREGFLH